MKSVDPSRAHKALLTLASVLLVWTCIPCRGEPPPLIPSEVIFGNAEMR